MHVRRIAFYGLLVTMALAALIGDPRPEQEYRLSTNFAPGGLQTATDAWEPGYPAVDTGNPVPRGLYSVVAYLLSAASLMTVLIASVATSCRPRRGPRSAWSDGLLWGIAGYTVFCLSMSALSYFMKAHGHLQLTQAAAAGGKMPGVDSQYLPGLLSAPASGAASPGDAGCRGEEGRGERTDEDGRRSQPQRFAYRKPAESPGGMPGTVSGGRRQ